MREIYGLIVSIIRPIREWLNSIRSTKPQTFDKAVKIITFLIPFVSCFAPALVTKNWLRAILEFVVLSIILLFQWSTYTNRIIEKENKIKALEGELIDKHNKIKDMGNEIASLNRDAQDYNDLFGLDETAYRERIRVLNQRFDNLAGFSHSISHNVKKITAEIEKPTDPRVVMKVTEFLQESLSALEIILSDHYGKEVRASIKITVDEDIVKTYARGRNNISSRGGEYPCSQLNQKPIPIESNYAYIAIVKKQRKFFAEGNLIDMQNKFEDDDVFFCEYGDQYLDLFYSTIVMPIRIPVFTGLPPEQKEPLQDILGMLCVDCKSEMSEWSMNTLTELRAYHIIADYADSLAILLKEYRDAS